MSHDKANLIAKYRELGNTLVQKLHDDPSFRTQVQDDPLAALTSAGLPEELISLFLQETELAEVQGYMDELELCFISN